MSTTTIIATATGSSAVLLSAAFLRWAWSKTRGHDHRLTPFGVQYVPGAFPSQDLTIVGLRCSCGMIGSKSMPGHWSILQVSEAGSQRVYPYEDGDTLVLGPECFLELLTGTIAYQGRWYTLSASEAQSGTTDG